jgi:hypothetical protein
MAVNAETKEIHFYLNGKESDARLGTGTQSPFVYAEPLKRYGNDPFYIGYSNSPTESFFKGAIASIAMWDRCLTSDEIKNMHIKFPENNLVLDLFTMALDFGNRTNVECKKEKIEIPHTILPHRRNGKFRCLPHQTEGLINEGGIEKWAKGETTAQNERRYILQMQQGKIDYKSDGINSMNYELISVDTIYNRHKLINVKA